MISVTAESPAALFMSSLDQKGASASKIFFGTPEWPELAVLMAIKNGCLREVQKEIRSQSHSHYRITFEALTQRVKVKNSQVEPSESKVFPTMMAGLTETERNWIESWVFDKTSLRAFGRQSGKDPRTAKRLLLSYLDKCRAVLEPGHGLSDQDSEGSAPRPS